MKQVNKARTVVWLLYVSLALFFFTGILITRRTNAQSVGNLNKANKVSADLVAQVAGSQTQDALKVILQLKAPMSGALKVLLNQTGVHTKANFKNLNAQSLEIPAGILQSVAAFDEVFFISSDRQTASLGHLSETTGADAVRTTNGITVDGLDGSGIGIAFLDSGIYSAHTNFLDKSSKTRVVVSQDFTGENRTTDFYGHGTHVASMAAGNGRVSNRAYLGIAPNANIINLRVLNSRGTGTVSAVLSALDWVMSNRATYNIRVVNISLGTAAIDSYKNDPICLAARRLVNVGIVVVAAAGNNGKDSAGLKVYGQIHCPGNEPSVITVGAANTFGTEARNDDGVTSYSSRGPTRSSWTDSTGSKHYDHLIKPDIVAPGNKLIGAEAINNLLVTQNLQLDAGVTSSVPRKQMILSGSSMSASVVSGGAALLLQANPTLTPNMVKAILMYSAQPLAGFNMLEQGAGELNLEGAMRLAQAVRTNLGTTKPLGAPLLATALPQPQTTIAGSTFTWSQGLILGQHFATGAPLIMTYQPIYPIGVLMSDNVIISGCVILSEGIIISDGVIITDGVTVSDGVIITDGVFVSDNVMLSDGNVMGNGSVFLAMGSIVSDGVIICDGVIITDGIIISDLTTVTDGFIANDVLLRAQSAQTNGDPTASSQVVLDTAVDN
ncbi:MAG: serine protease AprX [Pyrinomonadaceae bacterium]|jgi:subtilisin family serine protease/carbonic anhydrase/acetyltransferase-like protein (isoleucine patch superfamily)|nr:serine protease AprX [Pyrinomonadaceae bacterium]